MPCTPRMRACRGSCLHRQVVEDYRAARQAWWEAAEAATALYPAELEEYCRQHPAPNFRDWLIGQSARTERESAAA